MKIHVYWHIAQLNNWRTVVEQQLDRLNKSGLGAAAASITVVMLGEEQYDFPPNMKVLQWPELGLFEFMTLQKVWEDSKHKHASDDVVFYFHTKGVSRDGKGHVDDWRLYMERCLIDDWGKCAIKLKDFDTCGVEFRSGPKPHYSGNFWWATCEHIKRLPLPVVVPDRLFAEMWVLGSVQPLANLSCVGCLGLNMYLNKCDDGFDEFLDDCLRVVFDAGSDDEKFGGRFIGGFHLQQRPEELAPFLHHFDNLDVRTLWEIGTAAGGLARVLKDYYNIQKVVVVDDGQHSKAWLRDSVLGECVEFVGNSHSSACEEFLSGQPAPELCVIDGDHSYVGVRMDCELILGLVPKGCLIVFHDWLACHGVKQLFKDLRVDARVQLEYYVGDQGSGGLGLCAFRVV
jgi:hypothetical protein